VDAGPWSQPPQAMKLRIELEWLEILCKGTLPECKDDALSNEIQLLRSKKERQPLSVYDLPYPSRGETG